MCTFIFIVVPLDSDGEMIASIASRFNFTARATWTMPPEAIPSGLKALCTTTFHCDCGSVIGAGVDLRNHEEKLSSKVRELARRGWSTARIDRWQAQRQSDEPRSSHAIHEASRHDEALRWQSFLNALFDETELKRIGLFHHMDDNQPFSVRSGDSLIVSERDETRLRSFQDAVVYDIRRRYEFE